MLTARDDEGRGGSCRRGNGATDDLSRRGRGTAARRRGGLLAAQLDGKRRQEGGRAAALRQRLPHPVKAVPKNRHFWASFWARSISAREPKRTMELRPPTRHITCLLLVARARRHYNFLWRGVTLTQLLSRSHTARSCHSHRPLFIRKRQVYHGEPYSSIRAMRTDRPRATNFLKTRFVSGCR